jgi:predicted enzyme related to lactoylglutathione lyase
MPNPVVHFEIGCINTEAQQRFYGTLFDWDITLAGGEWNYGLVQHSEGGIGGGISQSGEDPARPMITFYVMVEDLRAYLDKAVSLGATEVLPPMDMEVNNSKFSIAGFIDPEGNYIGLFHSDKV